MEKKKILIYQVWENKMANSGFKLTKEQYDSIIFSFENDDRTRAYMDLHSYTGFPTANSMSQISHFAKLSSAIVSAN